jgi:membrane AbrB-like protein
MSEFTYFRERLPAIFRALAVGIPAGYLFHRLHTPIPWMIGPMIAVATLNLMGVRMHSPPFARQMGQVILGSAVALYFTPTVVAELAANFAAIVAATVAAFVVGGLGALTLSRVSGVEGKSAFFASIPGGAMAMAVLAERYGAQIAPVAVAHSLRVSLVVILIPLALTYGGIPLVASAYRPDVPLDYLILVPWLAFGFVLGEVSERLGLQNGYLMAPIFFGAAITMSGIQLSAVPRWMTDFAQLMFGLVLGALLRARLLRPLQALHPVRAVELVLRADRLGGGCRRPRLGLRSPHCYHDHRHRARRPGGDGHYRASSADQRAVGDRLPLVPSSSGQHGHPVHLLLRRTGAGPEPGPLGRTASMPAVNFGDSW